MCYDVNRIAGGGSPPMKPNPNEAIRAAVHEHYSSVATQTSQSLGAPEPNNPDCCEPSCCDESSSSPKEAKCCGPSCCNGRFSSMKIGYPPRILQAHPMAPIWGLAAATPQATVSLKQGEVVSISLRARASIPSLRTDTLEHPTQSRI